jgi:glycosyltransferase involved in cell wall biosynthesis
LNVGAYLSIFLHKPHIWHFREFAKQHYHYNYNVGERYQYALYSKCSACIIAISKSLRDYYSVALNISNIKLIYNGVKINADSYHRYSLEGEHHIALVGIVSKNKHQDVVVEAVTKIVKEYNASNVYLHILGSSVDAVYWEMLADMISENNMGDNILMHGYCPDIYPYLSLCDIGVLASEYEAFGRVTVEYMQCGIVPVVSNSGANVELVHNGYNGLVFQLNDVNQLTDCLLKLICDPPFLRELSTQAIIDGQNYTVETNAKKIIDIYNTLLKNTCC